MLHSPTPVLVHLVVDEMLVAAERFHDRCLDGRPVVVGGAPDSAGRVVGLSEEARACGVRRGDLLRDAARRCPGATFLAGDIERHHDFRALLEEIVRARGPALAWTALDEAVADMTEAGTAGARRWAEDLQECARRTMGASIAVGIASSAFVAGVAARLGRPRGLVLVLPGYDSRFLAPQPLDVLGLFDERTIARLLAAGVEDAADLTALSATRAGELLGRDGRRLLDALGGADSPPPRSAVPRRVCRQARVDDVAEIDGLLTNLSDGLSRALRRSGAAAATLGLRMEDAANLSRTHACSLGAPTAAPDRLLEAAGRLLARLGPSAGTARLLSLSATALVAAEAQGCLFEAPRRPAAATLTAPAHPPRRRRTG